MTRHRKLGHSNIVISPIIMGLWQAGGQYWAGIEDRESERAIHAALDAGITTFDTAEEYGAGHSERILGKALAGRRHEAVILTKVFSDHLARDQVIEACDRSLRNLGTDHIDLYQIHWPSGSWGSEPIPVAETMGALLELQQTGKIRAIGVSNFSRAQLEEISGVGRIESLQPPYSLFWRHIETEIQPWCEANQVSILAYSPLAQGILAGKLGPEPRFEKGDHRGANKLFLPDHYPGVCKAVETLRPIAKRKGITLAQLALAWLIHRPMTSAIAGARNRDQVTGNAGSMDVTLSPEDLAEIDSIGAAVAQPFLTDPVPWTWNP